MAHRSVFAVLAAGCVLTACASTPLASQSGFANRGDAAGIATSTTAPGTTAPGPTAPGDPAVAPVTTGLPSLPSSTLPVDGPPIEQVVDVGDAKSPRFYDSYLSAALNDIQAWWSEQYPILYGDAFVPLEGGIYAAYPERTTPIPGCGMPGNTTYQDVVDAGAFYCPDGDFMAYDDGEDGVVFQLAEEFGPSIVAVVMAHEFGHAIQQRLGTLNQDIPTVYTEQQADCYSGAWARRAWDGQVPGLPFTDADVELGLIALVEVRDPVGTNVLEPGGHGSAFDRIGAFQEGFYYGVERCADLIDHPLPLQPNEFTTTNEANTNGNAPFDGVAGDDIITLLNTDLTFYWPLQLDDFGVAMPALKITRVADPIAVNCGDPQRFAASGAIYCAQTSEILFDEAYGRALYDDYGDFAVGYMIGRAWAEGVQIALGSTLEGEARALTSDCLTGAWIGSAVPAAAGAGVVDHRMQASPGDLDEAVQTALVIGDPGINDNVSGSAFERVAYLRLGVVNGLPACLNYIQNPA